MRGNALMRKKGWRLYFRAALCALAVWAGLAGEGLAFGILQPAPTLGYRVVSRKPHDPSGFTQGLLFHDGLFYQSDGLYGKSRLVAADPETGRILREKFIPARFFGEGLALVHGKFYQLTWREKTVLLHDAATLEPAGELPLETEGWGAAYDGKRLVISDGSATIRFYQPETMRETGHVLVTDAGRPVANLNELEWVDGTLYANVWGDDRLAAIDPLTGKVTAWRDLSALRLELGPLEQGAVLNGVAHDPATGHFYVTGKLWPRLFEIELTDKPQ